MRSLKLMIRSCGFVFWFLFSYHLLYAQVDKTKKVLPEPKFTWKDSNIVIIDVPAGLYNYTLKFGPSLKDSIVSPDPVIEMGPQEIDSLNWRYYFKGFVRDLGTGKLKYITTSDSAFSLQDGQSPYLVRALIDTFEIKAKQKIFIGPITDNKLKLKISDLQLFKYRDVIDWDKETFSEIKSDSIGSGISLLSITRNNSLFFSWDTIFTNVQDTLPAETTFTPADNVLPAEGKYVFKLEMRDGAFQPDQRKNPKIKGNVGTDSFTVIYDTTAPRIDTSHIKDVYSSGDILKASQPNFPDSILLAIVFTDSLSGIDTTKFSQKNLVFTPNLNVLKYKWINCTESFDQCSLHVWLEVRDGDYSLQLDITDRSKNSTSVIKQFSIDTTPPKLIDFKIRDFDYVNSACLLKPDSGYTNNDSVIIGSFVYEGRPDSLHIFGERDTVIYFQEPADTILLSWIYPNYHSGDKLSITIAALDSQQNEQEFATAPKHTIIFDENIIPNISVSVLNKTIFDSTEPGTFRYGAYPLWVNNDTVNVRFNPVENDFFKVLRKSPLSQTCRNFNEEFTDSLTIADDDTIHFTYAISDSAGNIVQSTSSVYMDREMVPFKKDYIEVIDPSSGSSSFTDEDSVYIRFKNLENFNWHGIPDLSRYVINDSVIFNISDSVLFPVGDGHFTVSVVDSAGNESNSVQDSIQPVRPFHILSVLPQDSSQTGIQPVSGWTNDTTIFVLVEIDTSNGQDINKVRQLELAGDSLFTIDKEVYDIQPEDVISPSKIRVLYHPLKKNQKNSIYVRALGPLLEMISNAVDSAIMHDDIAPVLGKTVLHDTSDTTEIEYTDEPVVYIETKLPDSTYDAYQIFITEINPQSQTKRDTLDYSRWRTWPLSNGPGLYQITTAIVDSAGNQSEQKSASIEYRLKIPFAFILSDTSLAPYKADPGFTNDPQVKWRIFASDTVLQKLQKITFYDSTHTNSVLVTLPPGDSLLYIDQLYDTLSSGKKYKISAEIVLQGDIISDAADPFFISFDNTRPELSKFELSDLYPDKDILYKKLKAKTGWTDSLKINAHMDATDNVLLKEVTCFGDTDPGSISFQSDFQLSIKEKDTDSIYCFVSDPSGNRSDTLHREIKYLSQKITAKIDTLNPLFVDNTTILPNGVIEMPVSFTGGFLWQAFTWNDEGDSINYQTPGRKLIFPVPNDSGFVHVKIADSSGTMSLEDKIYLSVKNIPVIQLTLFDYSEFPAFQSPTDQLPEDWQRSDSLFTDEMNENKKVVALTRLISGDWDSIRIAPQAKVNLQNRIYKPIANANSDIDLREIRLPSDVDSLGKLTFYVQVKNNAGLEGDTLFSIIHDIRPPILNSFSGKMVVTDFNYSFFYSGSDQEPGEKAGIVICESFKEKSKYTYIATSDENKITLYQERGQRTLTAFLVDKADVDQNRPDLIREKLNRKELNFLDHKSNTKSIIVRFNPSEVSNFPNPFNPLVEDGFTKLMFPLKQAGHVRIAILDAFGNLVKSWDVQCEEGLNTGDNNEGLRWYGKNGKGKYVANGGYICIIKSDSGEQYVRKIAVVKKQD